MMRGSPIGTVQRWLITTGAGLALFILFATIYALLAGLSEALIGRDATDTMPVAICGLLVAFLLAAWLWRRLGRWLANRYFQGTTTTIFPLAPGGSSIRHERERHRYVAHGARAAGRCEPAETFRHLGARDEIGDFIDILPDPPALDRIERLPRPRK